MVVATAPIGLDEPDERRPSLEPPTGPKLEPVYMSDVYKTNIHKTDVILL